MAIKNEATKQKIKEVAFRYVDAVLALDAMGYKVIDWDVSTRGHREIEVEDILSADGERTRLVL